MSPDYPGPTGQAERFDGQAEAFDRRAGLPSHAVERIAEALLPLATGGAVLELGAGTGEIGIRLARRTGSSGPGSSGTGSSGGASSYIGLDVSAPMLRSFARRHAELVEHDRLPMLLAHADADRHWPVRDGSVGLLFASRSAHLLDPEHVAREARRVASIEGLVIGFGRVRRPRQSVRRRLRRELHLLLQQEGIRPRGKSAARRRLAERLIRQGARSVDITGSAANDGHAGDGHEGGATLASWPTVECPADALRDWRSKNGLAGHPLPHDRQIHLLDRLEERARELFGDPETAAPSTESYVLETFVFGEPRLAMTPFTRTVDSTGDPALPPCHPMEKV